MKFFVFVLLAVISLGVRAQGYIPLWPEGMVPNSKGMKLERVEDNERVTQIDVPGMYPFFTSKEENTGTAVLIFPSGGYQEEAYNIAGMQLAKWFNTLGVNAFVLMYRLPTSPDLQESSIGPLVDAQRAMKIIRAYGTNWEINPGKIGVMGTSAGGGLAANVATFTNDYSRIGDGLDSVSFTPDFQILVSGTISMRTDAHKGSHDALLGENPSADLERLFSGELNVKPKTPPAFIVCAANDSVVKPMNSIRYFEALQNNGIESCLHVFPKGAHSIALRNNPGSTNLWTQLCEAWLKEQGLLKP